MVEFNGIEINQVAPVNVLDVVISAAPVNVATLDVPLLVGSKFVRRKIGTRTVTVTFVLMEEDEEARRRYLADIVEWATSDQEQVLKSTPDANGHLMAVCSQYPEQSSKQYWEVLTLAFTASDPRYIENNEHTESASGEISVTKKQAPLFRIEQTISSAISDATWRLGSEFVKLSGQVSPGKLVIDFDRESVTLNGESVAEKVTIDSTFFKLSQGKNKIVCENGAGGSAYWRERWI